MNYLTFTRIQLIKLCKEKNIKNYSNKNKQGIIDVIIQFDNPEISIPKIYMPKIKTADKYTQEFLKEQFALHMKYTEGRINTSKRAGIKVRLPSIPEDITENIIKFIIHNKCGDLTTSWNCKTGDLVSKKEGKQECKCFTSDGPLSFTPTSDWDVIYFLDARNWLNNKFILYKSSLKKSSTKWKQIKVNKNQTFNNQCDEKRRPRLSWELLYSQIVPDCIKIYEGSFEDIFIASNEDSEDIEIIENEIIENEDIEIIENEEAKEQPCLQ